MPKVLDHPETAPKHDILTRYRVRLEPEGDGETLFVRALSDLDIDDREKYALITSAKTRRALRDTASDDHAAHIAPLADFSDDELRLRVQIERMSTTLQEVLLEVEDTKVSGTEAVAPHGSSLEERERATLEALEADESHDALMERRRQALYEQKMTLVRERVALASRDALLAEAADLVIASRASASYRLAARRSLVALATYTDAACTVRKWDLASNPQIPPALQNELSEKYAEVGNVSLRFLTARY